VNPGARVLITGAASGIGAATVSALRERGAYVVGLDLRPGESGDVIACDVTDQDSVDSAVAAAIERLGGLDVLINCAGVGDPQSAGTRPDEAALRVIDVNMLGPWRVAGAAMPALRESRGRVVNVSSGLAYLAIPLAPAYCMSKRGIAAYSDSLRLEHGDAISVTTVYPGYIRTPIHDSAAAKGIGLEGVVPPESVRDAAAALVRASLDPRPPRDLATTRRGGLGYLLLRFLPRRVVDWGTRRQMRKAGIDPSHLYSASALTVPSPRIPGSEAEEMRVTPSP
jgi:NAD(P)-dependent dehydrogenase (short-subunit alcohol dehydrogenase family)